MLRVVRQMRAAIFHLRDRGFRIVRLRPIVVRRFVLAVLVDSASDDYRLRSDSPCKNAGTDLGPLP